MNHAISADSCIILRLFLETTGTSDPYQTMAENFPRPNRTQSIRITINIF